MVSLNRSYHKVTNFGVGLKDLQDKSVRRWAWWADGRGKTSPLQNPCSV